MGWTFECSNRRLKEFIVDRCKGWDWVDDAAGCRHIGKCIAHKYVRYNPGQGTLWKVMVSTTLDNTGNICAVPDPWIAVDLVRWGGGRGNGWGYKDMEASSGPCDISCPLKYLDMVPEPKPCKCLEDSSGFMRPGCELCYERRWREQVRAAHAERAAKRRLIASLGVGDKLYLKGATVCGKDELIVHQVKPRLWASGWYVKAKHIDYERTLAAKTEVAFIIAQQQ